MLFNKHFFIIKLIEFFRLKYYFCYKLFKIKNQKRYTVTAALPYTNGPIHIGHLAGVYIPADIFVRYHREKKNDVLFICGSDEHGVAITIKAKKEKTTPREIIDKYHKIIKESFTKLGISFDNYSRTSKKIHHETASEFFKSLYDQNKLIEKTSDQLYDNEEKQFLADRYVTGECPKCYNKNAYGDQCEKCGSTLSPEELINPKSTISGSKPIIKKTKHWFLPLDRYEKFISSWIEKKDKAKWKSNVIGQVKSWVENGLQPRAITRDLKWGIPVPLNGIKDKVLYVWFDAPIGYISSTKEWAELNNKDWKPYWLDENTELIHFIGKDNIVFHCIIFPIILKEMGNYILPKNVPANEFLNLEGEKISTSKNWAVWLPEFLKDFKNDTDILRYVLISNMPETKDSDFSWKDFQSKNNNELVSILGNFINRVFVLINKNYEGNVPKMHLLTSYDKNIISKIKTFPVIIGNLIENYKFREALKEMMNISRIGNKYLADEEPWKLFTSDPMRASTIMFISIQITCLISVLSRPFMPNFSIKLSNMLNFKFNLNWDLLSDKYPYLKNGHKINKSELIFSKIEDSFINEQIEKLKKNSYLNQV